MSDTTDGAQQNSTVCIPHLLHSSVSGHLGCCHVLADVSSTIVNIAVHVSSQFRVSSGYVPRNGIAGSHGSSIPRF